MRAATGTPGSAPTRAPTPTAPASPGFDDGYHLWGELLASGWTLIEDPAVDQFPYAFRMGWRPRSPTNIYAPACELAAIWMLGAVEADRDIGMTYDDDPGSARSRAYAAGRSAAQAPETRSCVVSYCEGDFGVAVYDDMAAYRAGLRATA